MNKSAGQNISRYLFLSLTEINWLLGTTWNFLQWCVTSVDLKTSASHSLEDIMKSCLSISSNSLSLPVSHPNTDTCCYLILTQYHRAAITSSTKLKSRRLRTLPFTFTVGKEKTSTNIFLSYLIFFSSGFTANACHLRYWFMVII